MYHQIAIKNVNWQSAGWRSHFVVMQAALRHVLVCCPPQLTKLNGKPLSDSERRLTALTQHPDAHFQSSERRGTHSASTAESYRRKQRSHGAQLPSSAAASARAGGRSALGWLCDSAGAQLRGSGGSSGSSKPARAELQGGTHLVIHGNALHALAVCPLRAF